MDVIKAILARHSVRDFSSKPVAKETVMKILEAATCSPSGGNAQPWEVFVATGATLEKIRKIYLDRYQAEGIIASAPTPRPSFIQERMVVIRNERFKLLGLDPSDPASGKIFLDWGARLFGVPILLVICMDKALSTNTDFLNIGIFVQTICLAAKGYGVDSLIATAFVSRQDVLYQELAIPENLSVVTGIGLGYPDKSATINAYRSPRRPVQEVVRYKS